jgi:hypothetical protein
MATQLLIEELDSMEEKLIEIREEVRGINCSLSSEIRSDFWIDPFLWDVDKSLECAIGSVAIRRAELREE